MSMRLGDKVLKATHDKRTDGSKPDLLDVLGSGIGSPYNVIPGICPADPHPIVLAHSVRAESLAQRARYLSVPTVIKRVLDHLEEDFEGWVTRRIEVVIDEKNDIIIALLQDLAQVALARKIELKVDLLMGPLMPPMHLEHALEASIRHLSYCSILKGKLI